MRACARMGVGVACVCVCMAVREPLLEMQEQDLDIVYIADNTPPR